MCCLLHCFTPLGKGNTSKSSGVAEELEEQINAGAIGWALKKSQKSPILENYLQF